MKVSPAIQLVLISQGRPRKLMGMPSEPQDTEYGGIRVGKR